MSIEKIERTPQRIIGDDAYMQLVFEGYEVVKADELSRLREVERRANRVATDRLYMMQAYRNMLGEKGLEVAAMWDRAGVLRFHMDWTAEGRLLTGEERAQQILDIEKLPKRLIENIDRDLPTEPFLSEWEGQDG